MEEERLSTTSSTELYERLKVERRQIITFAIFANKELHLQRVIGKLDALTTRCQERSELADFLIQVSLSELK